MVLETHPKANIIGRSYREQTALVWGKAQLTDYNTMGCLIAGDEEVSPPLAL